MSTSSLIAWADGDGYRQATYVHWNGYPSLAGPTLARVVNTAFGGDIAAALEVLTAHSHWSLLEYEGFEDNWNDPEGGQREIYSDTDRWERIPGVGIFDKTEDWRPADWHGGPVDCDVNWIYVLDPFSGILTIGYPEYKSHKGTPRFVAAIPLGSDADWEHIECGNDLERCPHYCYVHFPDAPMDSQRLDTATYLGREPFDINDAVGCWKNGVYYKLTGSGYLERRQVTGHPDGVGLLGVKTVYGSRWFATVEAPDGTRGELAVWHNYKTVPAKPCKGITLVFPPIREAVSE